MVVIRSAVSGEQLGCCDVEAVAELKAWVADQLEVPEWEQRYFLDGQPLSELSEASEVELLRLESSFALAAADGNALELLEHLQDDKDVVLSAVRSRGSALRFASTALRGDREVALAAVAQDGGALQFVLQPDREVVLVAVGNSGLAIRYASEPLRRDLEVAATAMLEDQRAVAFVPQELWAEAFEEAQRISKETLRSSLCESRVAHAVRYVPCCLGGLAGCLLGPLATGFAVPTWLACLTFGSGGVLLGVRALEKSQHF